MKPLLVPVGVQFNSETAWTNSILGSSEYETATLFQVEGIFIFSGFDVGVRHVGGGGGFQDAFFRYDHIRAFRPCIYPVVDWPLNAKLVMLDERGRDQISSWKPQTLPVRLSGTMGEWGFDQMHKYIIRCHRMEEPLHGAITEEKAFGHRLSNSTYDNAGGLFVTALAEQSDLQE